MARLSWTFLTNHAQVLLCVANNPHVTAREIAVQVRITERAVQRIVDDLETAGYLSRYREGRNNRYEVNLDRPLRHPVQRGQPVRDLFDLLLRYFDTPQGVGGTPGNVSVRPIQPVSADAEPGAEAAE